MVALPVLWYHQVAFGSPFSVGSAELPLIGVENVGLTLPAVGRELLDRREFLYLLPFVLWGALRGWRSFRLSSVVLLAWLVAIGLFHLSYSALRARDLLSVFPVLALWAGIGMADGLAAAQAWSARGHAWRSVLPLLVALAVVACLWARGRETLDNVTGRPYFTTFGYLQPEQRRAFDTLAALTPARRDRRLVTECRTRGPLRRSRRCAPRVLVGDGMADLRGAGAGRGTDPLHAGRWC